MRQTIFVVEQDVAVALELATVALERATTAYVFENGRVVLSGPTARLKTDPHVKTAYLER